MKELKKFLSQILYTPQSVLLLTLLFSSQGVYWQSRFAVGLIILVAVIATVSSRRLMLLAVVVIGVLVGGFMGEWALNNYKTSVSAVALYQKEDHFSGVIVSEPKRKFDDKASFEFVIDQIDGSKIEPFRSYTSTRDLPIKHFGDRCELVGEIGLPRASPNFDFGYYLKQKSIGNTISVGEIQCTAERLAKELVWRKKLIVLREKVIDRIEYSLPEPYSSLLAGILFGVDRVFEPHFADTLQMTGTTHIIAASGYNINLVILLVYIWLGRIGIRNYKGRLILSLIFVWVYVVIAGIGASVVRAAAMGSAVLVKKLFGVDIPSWYLILFMLAMISIINPGLITQIGFLLSLSATLGLNLFMDRGEESENWLKDLYISYLKPTFWATLATAPILIAGFKSFSFIGLLSNVLVLPVLESSMLIGFFATISSFMFGSEFIVTKALFMTVYWQLLYFERVTLYLARYEFLQVTFTESTASRVAIIGYLIIALILFIRMINHKEENNLKLTK